MTAGSAAVDPALRAIWAEVLGVDAPDIDDDFFLLGGNSLLATQITARVADVLGVDVALDALFEAPTLGAYAEQVRAAATEAPERDDAAPVAQERRRGGGLRGLLRARRGGGLAQEPAPGAAGIGGASPDALSAPEASAWSVQQYDPGVQPHVGQVFSLQGQLDVAALERAFTALVARHEPLRTSYPRVEHRPRARVHPAAPVRIEPIGSGRRMREEEVRRHVDAAWDESFDYTTTPPLRVRLIRTGRSSAVLAFVLHEVVCDGQSYDLLVRELGQLYTAESAGAPSPLAEPPRQFRDVVRERGPRLSDPAAEAAGRAYWHEALAGAPLALPLPHGPLGVGDPGREGSYTRRAVRLSPQLVERLQALAQEETATSFMLHLAALYALLHRWTGETELVVRAPSANRQRTEWEQIVGFFSAVLPLRVRVDDDPSFRTLLRRARDSALGGFRHASLVPEDNALRELSGLHGLGGWTVMFRLWDPTTEQPLELASVSAKPYRDEGEAGQLVLVVTERSDGRTVAQLSSSTPDLDGRALGELMHHYERLLEQVAEDPGRRVGSEVELLSPSERDRLGGRPSRGSGAEAGGGLHGLVEAATRRAPDAVAFDAGGGAAAISYGELDARARRIAVLLRTRGVGAGDAVGLALPPSGDLLAALLGVLRAAAVAVPLAEPGLNDARAGLPPLATVLDAGALAALPTDGEPAAGDDVDPDRVAMVLRTTGVTGGPRAVELTHGALCRAALRQRDAQRLTASDRVAHVPGRGAWSWALAPWAALSVGATVVGPERAPQARSETPATGWLAASATSVAVMDPWLATATLEHAPALPATLRLLCVQGAGPLTVPPEAGGRGRLAVQRWYGLTEMAGLVMATRVASGSPADGSLPGLRARVLDRYGNVVPAGVVGELALDDARTLRTGDLARRRADGALELVGRAEDELRWRGVRLQPILLELETALAGHPGVQGAAACWVPEHEALVACLVPRRAQPPGRAQLDEWLQSTMRDWILPAAFAAVDAIPQRPDGLPDRRALAALPAVARALGEATDREPRSATERTLAAAWTQVLGVQQPHAHDNFFAAGGTLVLGLELVERARAAGVAIEPADVLYRPTIAALAAAADSR